MKIPLAPTNPYPIETDYVTSGLRIIDLYLNRTALLFALGLRRSKTNTKRLRSIVRLRFLSGAIDHSRLWQSYYVVNRPKMVSK